MQGKSNPFFTCKTIKKFWLFLIAVLIGWACNLPGLEAPNPTPPAEPTPSVVATVIRSTDQIVLPIKLETHTPGPVPTQSLHTNTRLTQNPLYWFSPLPPLPASAEKPAIGSQDFYQLFRAGAPWDASAEHLQVFKLDGKWAAYQASDQELIQVVESLRQKGLALAVEVDPLTSADACGQNLHGFGGVSEGLEIARRIKNAGGVISLIAMDAPYFYGHFFEGPNACGWTDEKIGRDAGQFILAMRSVYPDLLAGDIEPITGSAGASEYQAWMVAFKAINQYNLSFLHLDIDWSRPSWPQEMIEIENFGRYRGIPIGVIYSGNDLDINDQAWISIAGERIKQYEIETGGRPDHVVFQSRHDKPDHTLPESDPFTFTGWIKTYFEDRSNLGFRPGGAGTNLAYQKPVRYSQALPNTPGELAVDGNPATFWSAGENPLQWIEINLGTPHTIQAIRLILSQSSAGMSVQRVRGRSSAEGAQYITLHTFAGVTNDFEQLFYSPEEAWEDIQYVRIETLQSPCWVAWREIEIFNSGLENDLQ